MVENLRQRLRQTHTRMPSWSVKTAAWIWRILQGLSRLWWAGLQAEGRAAREESEALERIRDRWRR